jgi:hypothetical protein
MGEASKSEGELREVRAVTRYDALDSTPLEQVDRWAEELPGGRTLLIADVQPTDGPIMSDRPFALRVRLMRSGQVEPVLASVRVEWAGASFVVEQRIPRGAGPDGHVDVLFGRDQTLPAGPVRFRVAVFDAEGGQARFRLSCLVLPSNPLSVHVAARTGFVTTGTHSARAKHESGDVFRTRVTLTIANGAASAVTIDDKMVWKFWNGGVGGTLVESGTQDWGSNFQVPAHGSWSADLTVRSPNGSGIYERYHDKEDLTLEVSFKSTAGRTISDTVACRVMVAFSVNVIRVSEPEWTSREYDDLYAAVDLTRSIYEARDVTIDDVEKRHMSGAGVAAFSSMNSESEVRDCFQEHSGPDNKHIDVFLSHDHTTDFDGLAGDIPGPTSHAGRRSGVWADKTGYTDTSGHKRLHIEYLAMLIGHELGHYLGLSHVTDAGNLMLSSSGETDTHLSYSQYKEIADHGWVFVD